MPIGAQSLIQASYFVAAALFIFGLKRMSSPKTARGGIVWAGVGMLVATLITFLSPAMHNYALMTVAIVIGGVIAMPSTSASTNSSVTCPCKPPLPCTARMAPTTRVAARITRFR